MILKQLTSSFSTVTLSLALWAGGELVPHNYPIGSSSSVGAETNSPSILAQNISDRDLESIENLIFDSIQAYNQEDIQAVMDSIHPSSPTRQDTQEMSEYAFLMYDLNYETNDLEIVEISPSEIVVRITLTTIKIDGPEFNDNRSVSLQTLRKYNGEWKFFDLVGIETVEYLKVSY